MKTNIIKNGGIVIMMVNKMVSLNQEVVDIITETMNTKNMSFSAAARHLILNYKESRIEARLEELEKKICNLGKIVKKLVNGDAERDSVTK